MKVQHTATLDFTDNGVFETGWRIKQGDYGNTELVLRLVNNGVNVYNAGITPQIAFRRWDGASVISVMTPNDQTYKYAFAGNELEVPGLTLCDVKFTDAEGRVSTASCRFTVVEDTIGYDPTGAHTYDNPVSELVEQATNAAEVGIESSLKAEGFAVGEQGGVPVEEGSPYYHNNAKYYSNLAGDPIGTAVEEQTTTTGQFTTKTGGKLESCVIAFEPKQSGSGTPSPSNVRPITGHSSVEVTVSDKNAIVVEYIIVNLGGTYYGGRLDVVSGVLTVEDVCITENDFDMSSGTSGGGLHYFNIKSALNGRITDKVNVISNMLTYVSSGAWASTTPCVSSYESSGAVDIRVYDDSTSIENFKTKYSGLQIVYPIATPLTIQLTPQQINTLIGENYLDVPLTGQSLTSAVYREVFAWDDVNDVVNLRVPISAIGTDESNNDTASQAYSQGDYFYKNGIAKAKTSIASGATFTLGTNYEIKTLAEILKALES